MLRLLTVAASSAAVLAGSPWPASATQQASALLAQMTLEEKFAMVYGYGTKPYVGNVPNNTRLGIPNLNLEDGPQGVADGISDVTAWPSALTVVMSWDPSIMFEYGRAMGVEQFGKGTNVMLGPGVNLARVPWGGRNFEYQGEDPVLAAKMVAAEVQGIQSQNISGCVKHFVDNNQEYNRNTVSEQVGQRAQWELYYQPFAAAVDAGVGSAMCSYNRINNTYACENAQTLGDLKGPMGFRGWVMSDWGATHSTVASALNGLDQQMPDDGYFGQALQWAVGNGTVPESRIDDMVMRMLVPLYALNIMGTEGSGTTRNLNVNVMSEEHNNLARKFAEQSITLLKNDGGLLPLSPFTMKTIAVFGDNTTVTGGGSGGVRTPYVINPADGIAPYAAESGATIVYNEGLDPVAAAAIAATADVAIVVVATSSHEGADRFNLSLPVWHDALVAAVAAAQKNTIVVARCPGACLMPWSASVPAILFQLMPGQEAGNALASAIFGDVNPSGKLPISFPNSMNDTWLSPVGGGPVIPTMWPGTDRGNGWLEADYTEDLLMGYRWYDSQLTNPLWPFGHGLSYTTFNYGGFLVTGSVSSTTTATVQVTVTNIGLLAGAEVVQLYLGYPAAANEPPKLLKNFQKFALTPNAAEIVTFPLATKDIQIWDVTVGGWTVVPGTYTVMVGSSSRDIRLAGAVTVSA